MTNIKLLCSVVVGSLALLACSKHGESAEAQNASTATNKASGAEPMASSDMTAGGQDSAETASVLEPGPVGAAGPSDTTTPNAPPAAAAAPTPLTDGQIIKVAETVDQGEIEQAREMQKKARTPDVKKLATHLLQQHTKSRQKAETLAKKAQLKSEDSAVASDLTAKAEECLQTIKTAGAPADAERAFLDAQVRQHETVLELLNTRLIPNAMNAELKAQLEETRKMIEMHMEETRRVQQALDTGTAAAPPAG